ncbi:ras-related protein rab-4b [Plakobranchus ocellatus]|uniref:Ras-related protein rab-4b n=1 Tax=Plakobranchus ocellatus TaxID=259542 RepID=A0AAV4C0H7_9GAST|nr:ras-related protein rab-4b [Plakobranchus ocellatus]
MALNYSLALFPFQNGKSQDHFLPPHSQNHQNPNKMSPFYLDSVVGDSRRKEKYAKLCLVGEVGVGKTSLAKRFVEGKHLERYRPTMEVCHYEHKIATQGYSFNLVVWDTAGSERFRAMTAHSIRGASAVLLVFDVAVKKSYDELLNYWLPKSREWAPEALMVIVGNKIDQDLPWAVTPKEILSFCNQEEISFYQTSARTGTNVKEFFVEVGTNAIKRNMEDVREDEDLMGSFRVAAGDEVWRQPRQVAEKHKKSVECPSCTIL